MFSTFILTLFLYPLSFSSSPSIPTFCFSLSLFISLSCTDRDWDGDRERFKRKWYTLSCKVFTLKLFKYSLECWNIIWYGILFDGIYVYVLNISGWIVNSGISPGSGVRWAKQVRHFTSYFMLFIKIHVYYFFFGYQICFFILLGSSYSVIFGPNMTRIIYELVIKYSAYKSTWCLIKK